MGTKQISRFRIALIGGLIVFVLVVLCGAYLLRPSLRARYLFHELEPLQVGHSTFEDAQRLAKKLGAKPDNRLSPCDRKYCYWTAVVNNARLPQWWRGSGVTFVIDFLVENSVVVNKGAWYAIGIDPYTFTPSMVSVGEQETWLRPRRENRGIEEWPTAKGWGISYFEKNGHREGISTKFQVHLTPRSSAEDWRRYTAFNYGCLWKYKGCKDARDLLQTADPMPTY
jgi:hypothetical protein